MYILSPLLVLVFVARFQCRTAESQSLRFQTILRCEPFLPVQVWLGLWWFCTLSRTVILTFTALTDCAFFWGGGGGGGRKCMVRRVTNNPDVVKNRTKIDSVGGRQWQDPHCYTRSRRARGPVRFPCEAETVSRWDSPAFLSTSEFIIIIMIIAGMSFLRDFADFREKWSPVSGKLTFVQRKRHVGASKNLVKNSFWLQIAPNWFLG